MISKKVPMINMKPNDNKLNIEVPKINKEVPMINIEVMPNHK